MVDCAAEARFLLEQQLLASLDEEVGDVQDPDRELLLEELEQGLCSRRIVGVLALQVLGQELDETHLASQEPRRGELRDEAPPGVAAEKKIRLEIRRVREVACPAIQGDLLVRLDAGPVVLGNIQPAGHVGDPAVQQRGGAER